MIKLELTVDETTKSYSIPTSWNEVTVLQAQELFNIKAEDKTPIEIGIEVLWILGCIPSDFIYAMSPEQFTELMEAIKFTNEEVEPSQVESIKIGEDEYFLKNDLNKLTMGELITIETLVKQAGDNYVNAMSKLLCVFLRKKLSNGELETFKNSFMEREAMFNECKITDVNSIFLFFSSGENELT
jgi:hypothetical protein